MISEVTTDDLDCMETIGKLSLPIYYKKKELFSFLNDKYHILRKITYDNKLSGFYISKLHEDRIHIMSIGIHPEKRNKKLGTKLLEYIKNSNLPITLFVQQSNKIAINFYKKNDFKVLKSIGRYYYNLECNDAYFMCYKQNK